jgi:hypothetical protein
MMYFRLFWDWLQEHWLSVTVTAVVSGTMVVGLVLR